MCQPFGTKELEEQHNQLVESWTLQGLNKPELDHTSSKDDRPVQGKSSPLNKPELGHTTSSSIDDRPVQGNSSPVVSVQKIQCAPEVFQDEPLKDDSINNLNSTWKGLLGQSSCGENVDISSHGTFCWLVTLLGWGEGHGEETDGCDMFE